MDIYVYKKEYYKESPELQSSIINAINVLYERITEYEKQGITFEKICNDDKVKYDKTATSIPSNFKSQICSFAFSMLTYLLRMCQQL